MRTIADPPGFSERRQAFSRRTAAVAGSACRAFDANRHDPSPFRLWGNADHSFEYSATRPVCVVIIARRSERPEIADATGDVILQLKRRAHKKGEFRGRFVCLEIGNTNFPIDAEPCALRTIRSEECRWAMSISAHRADSPRADRRFAEWSSRERSRSRLRSGSPMRTRRKLNPATEAQLL